MWGDEQGQVVYLKDFDPNAKEIKTIVTDGEQEIKNISNMAR
jgi:hypothetical protein